MPAPIRLVVRFTPFPPGFVGDLSKYNQALIDRIEVLSPYAGLQWQIGGIKPTSNVGPWLNDLGQPFTWNETLKDYVPMDISLSLGDYESQLDAMQAQIDALPTEAEMDAAIAAAVGGVVIPPTVNTYPAAAKIATPQSLPIDAAPHKVLFDSVYLNPDARFDAALSRYTAPVAGTYRISSFGQVSNVDGASGTMGVGWGIYINSTLFLGIRDETSGPSGDRWWPLITTLVYLNANDYLEIWADADDTVLGGTTTSIDNANFAMELVKAG